MRSPLDREPVSREQAPRYVPTSIARLPTWKRAAFRTWTAMQYSNFGIIDIPGLDRCSTERHRLEFAGVRHNLKQLRFERPQTLAIAKDTPEQYQHEQRQQQSRPSVTIHFLFKLSTPTPGLQKSLSRFYILVDTCLTHLFVKNHSVTNVNKRLMMAMYSLNVSFWMILMNSASQSFTSSQLLVVYLIAQITIRYFIGIRALNPHLCPPPVIA